MTKAATSAATAATATNAKTKAQIVAVDPMPLDAAAAGADVNVGGLTNRRPLGRMYGRRRLWENRSTF